MTEDEMVGWYHRLDGHEFEQALGVGDGQGSLLCCSPWGCRESDTTEPLSNSSTSTLSCIQHRRVHSNFLPFLLVIPLLTVRNFTSVTLNVFTYFFNPPLGAKIIIATTPAHPTHTPSPCTRQLSHIHALLSIHGLWCPTSATFPCTDNCFTLLRFGPF